MYPLAHLVGARVTCVLLVALLACRSAYGVEAAPQTYLITDLPDPTVVAPLDHDPVPPSVLVDENEGVIVEGGLAPAIIDSPVEFAVGPEPIVSPESCIAQQSHGCGHGVCAVAGCRDCAPADVESRGLLRLLAGRRDWCWQARFDSILMWRNAPRNRPLFSTVVPGTTTLGPTALNANQLQSDPLAAPRVSLFRSDGCGESLEATYIYAGNFYAQRSLPFVLDGYALSPPGIFTNRWGPATGTALSEAQATLTGNLQSAELNCRTALGIETAQFLFGFRWLQWYEKLQMTDRFSRPPLIPGPPVIGQDSYLTTCTNNLIGSQIGFDFPVLTTWKGFRVDGLVKAGGYYNAASQSSAFDYSTSAPFAYGRQVTAASPGGACFVGELGLTGVVPLSQAWDFRFGYFGLWLEGLAQPANQLSGQVLNQIDEPAGTLDLTGGLVLQGVSLGLEGRW